MKIINENVEKYEQYIQCRDLFANIILGILNNVSGINCWVAGGVLKNYFSGIYTTKSDIDVFFPNFEEYERAVNVLKEKTGTEGRTIYDSPSYNEENDELKNGKPRYTNFIYNGNVIQLIAFEFFYGPVETIEKFDFTCCCCAIDLENIYYHETFFIDLARKKLVINSLPYPLSTLRRLQKYIKNGFTICSGGLLEIAKSINDLTYEQMDENNIHWYID